jgi:hypothetical protein
MRDVVVNETAIRTWNLLPALGFQPDDTIFFSDIRPGLSIDFGDFKLSAVAVTNPYSGAVVSFSGLYSTPRTLADIHFELPRRVESLKQCAAWIVWCLDRQWDGQTFRPARTVDWIDEGRQNRRLLPWVMSQAEYEARPQCIVRREWLRLGLKELRDRLAWLPDNVSVTFSFDGVVFRIQCDKKIIAFPGEGRPWTVCFTIEGKTLRDQPKRRLMSDIIGVSIGESRICLGPWSCEGEIESSDLASPSEFQ